MSDRLALSSISSTPAASVPGSSRRKLEDSCRQFEGFFLAEMMKQSKKAGSVSAEGEREAFSPLEETAVEMSARSISEKGEGMGLWKVLYDDLCRSLPEEDDA